MHLAEAFVSTCSFRHHYLHRQVSITPASARHGVGGSVINLFGRVGLWTYCLFGYPARSFAYQGLAFRHAQWGKYDVRYVYDIKEYRIVNARSVVCYIMNRVGIHPFHLPS